MLKMITINFLIARAQWLLKSAADEAAEKLSITCAFHRDPDKTSKEFTSAKVDISI